MVLTYYIVELLAIPVELSIDMVIFPEPSIGMDELSIVIVMLPCAKTGAIIAPPIRAAAANMLNTTNALNLFMQQNVNFYSIYFLWLMLLN